jgi:hypothetical protein
MLVARDLVAAATLMLAEALRSSEQIAAGADAVAVVNAALRKLGVSYRLVPLH